MAWAGMTDSQKDVKALALGWKIEKRGTEMSRIPWDPLYWLLRILGEDDAEQLRALLEDHKEEIGASTYPELLEECLSLRAKNCVFLMLNPHVGSGGMAPFSSPDVFRRALRIDHCDPEIVGFLFKNFGGKQFANEPCHLGYLPIHVLLCQLHKVFPLSQWPRDDALVKLLILLCHPKLREKLECVRLLADYTDSIHHVAVSLLYNGDVIELAALLLLTHPTILPSLKSVCSSTNAMNDVLSRAIVGKFPNLSGFGLIDIFDKAGDSLTHFYTSMPSDISGEDLIKGVAKILIRDANISISKKDVDLGGVLSVDPDLMPSIHEYLSIKMDDGMDKGPNPDFRSMRAVDYRCFVTPMGDGFTRVSPAQWKRYQRLGRELYHTQAFQSPKLSSNSQAWVAPSPSVRGMTSLAMRLKRAIRFF